MEESSGTGESSREATESDTLLYHEVQESRLCAMHCLNAVLQGPYFSEVDLAGLAERLDQQEQQMMLEAGADSSHYLNFVAEGSSNVAADGNFSIQVLSFALENLNLQCVPLESPRALLARSNPQQETAFICHLQAHWFCIRKVGGKWYNFNSLYAAPELLSDFYLSAYLDTLVTSGWSIFVVQGKFPTSSDWGTEGVFGRWLTPQQAEDLTTPKLESANNVYRSNVVNRAAKNAEVGKGKAAQLPAQSKAENESRRIGSENLAAALAASLDSSRGSFRPQDTLGEFKDSEYAAAIAATLASIRSPATSVPQQQQQQPVQQVSLQLQRQHQQQQPNQEEAAALARTLAQSFFTAARNSGLKLPLPPKPDPPKE